MIKDYSISFTRMVAFLFIIACHLLQHFFQSNLAWVFNVGVQMFLVISGYLYGGRERFLSITGEPIGFLKKCTSKIMKKYLSYLIVLMALLTITQSGGNSFLEFLQWLIFREPIHGYGHNWYIPYILMCYFLTPIILLYLWSKDDHSFRRLILLILSIELIFDCFIYYFNPAWVNCYIIGLYLGKNEFIKKYDRKTVWIKSTIVLSALVVNAVRFIVKLKGIEFQGSYDLIYQRLTNYSHLLLGCGVFIICTWFYKALTNLKISATTRSKTRNFLNQSDKYSFDIFLVHPFFISGALAITQWIVNKYVASFIAILASIITAILFHYFDKKIWLAIELLKIKILKRT